MKLDKAFEILKKHQEWRRGENVYPTIKMQNTVEIGKAIDYALILMKTLRQVKKDLERDPIGINITEEYIEEKYETVKNDLNKL